MFGWSLVGGINKSKDRMSEPREEVSMEREVGLRGDSSPKGECLGQLTGTSSALYLGRSISQEEVKT